MFLPITLTMAAAAALINTWLAIRIGQVRTAEKISIGDGGSERLTRRMRAQANFVENAPFVVLLIAALELALGSATWLWAVGILFMLGRLAHGLGMDGGSLGSGRTIGTLITLLAQIGLAGAAIWFATVGVQLATI